MLSIYTFTLGREYYLNNLLRSIKQQNLTGIDIEHIVVCQGVNIDSANKSDFTKFVYWDKNVGIAEGMNRILPTLKGDIIIKLDEDALLYGTEFFQHVLHVVDQKPDAVWSPYPVGLIRNPGGPYGLDHEVIYSPTSNTYYTLRKVNHVGGFARISPGHTKQWKFDNDLSQGQSGNEDVQFSGKCKHYGIEMFYTENTLIVEHQESTLGQHTRYGESYFKGRF